MDLETGTLLVAKARLAIETYLNRGERLEWATRDHDLLEKRGVFVTLLEGSVERRLRGCIGAPYPDGPLISQLVEVAVEAATGDPRFAPLTSSEFKKVIVEVTVLSDPEVLKVRRPLDYKDEIRIGRDGIMVEGMGSRGLLLPQVAAEEGFDSEEFLSQCCLKAGLLPDAWLSGEVQVSRFEGEIFCESSPGGSVSVKRFDSK
jgi:uncharacterized protein